MKLSIIIPIYNVEHYVHACLESIFRQGLEDNDFEVILINDGTPDRSMEVIADIIEAHRNIENIEQQNQGMAVARNKGIEKASGDYLLFVDSDDLLIDNSVPYLLDKAISSKADLVVADYIIMNNEQIAQLPTNPIQQKDGRTQEKTGKELHIQDLSPYACYSWRTLFKREFIIKNNLRFLLSVCYEDIPFVHQCYFKANKCIKANWLLSVYRTGTLSTTSVFNKKKAEDFCVAIAKTWELTQKESLNQQQLMKLQNDIFAHYSKLVCSLTSCPTISRTEKMEVLHYLKKLIPDLSFHNGFKQRFVSFFYQRMPSAYITLRLLYANYIQETCWTIKTFIRHLHK